MGLKRLICENCGQPLEKKGDLYVCPYCGATYQDDQAERTAALLENALEAYQIESLSKARRALYDAVHTKYPSDKVVIAASTAVLAIRPEDFLARFYLHSHDGDPYELISILAHESVTSCEAKEAYLWLLRSLDTRIVGAIKDFAARHLEGKEKTEALNAIEEEARRVDEGIYDVNEKREVFLCYSAADMPRVIEIMNLLEENGLHCFAAFRNLRHGKGAQENYQNAIFTAMKNARVFVFLSSASSRSRDRKGVVEELDHLKSSLPNKPRVEFLLEDYSPREVLAKKRMAEIFKNLEHCRDEEDLVIRVSNLLDAEENAEKERVQKLAAEAAKKAKEEIAAEYEAREAERKKHEAEEQAKREKEAEERRAKEVEEQERLKKQAREIEEQRLALEKEKLEIEKQRTASSASQGSSAAPLEGDALLEALEKAQNEKRRREAIEAERRAEEERRREEEKKRREEEKERERIQRESPFQMQGNTPVYAALRWQVVRYDPERAAVMLTTIGTPPNCIEYGDFESHASKKRFVDGDKLFAERPKREIGGGPISFWLNLSAIDPKDRATLVPDEDAQIEKYLQKQAFEEAKRKAEENRRKAEEEEKKRKERAKQKFLAIKSTPKVVDDGKAILFGLYPQSEVKDPNLLSKLKYMDGTKAPVDLGYGVWCQAKEKLVNYKKTKVWFLLEPIRWIVLSHQGEEVFVISEKALENEAWGNSKDYQGSHLDVLLRYDFENAAFSSRSRIIIKRGDGRAVFAPTKEEVKAKNLDNGPHSDCEFTDWASIGYKFANFWTSTPAEYDNGRYRAWYVNKDHGTFVDYADNYKGVRPCMYVRLDAPLPGTDKSTQNSGQSQKKETSQTEDKSTFVIPAGSKTVDIKTFSGGSIDPKQIVTVVIPEGVETINPYAFHSLENLQKFIVKGNPRFKTPKPYLLTDDQNRLISYARGDAGREDKQIIDSGVKAILAGAIYFPKAGYLWIASSVEKIEARGFSIPGNMLILFEKKKGLFGYPAGYSKEMISSWKVEIVWGVGKDSISDVVLNSMRKRGLL